MRKGVRYVSDEEAIFLAEGAGLDPEIALLGCHADRNDNPSIKAMWESIAKSLTGAVYKEYQWLAEAWLCGLAARMEQLLSAYYVHYVKYGVHLREI